MHSIFAKIAAVAAAFCIFGGNLTAAAVELPDGAVKGLPEKLTVMDSSGNSVSESGDYFFEVTDMQPYVSYSKDIQIINLREDYAYNIYFYAEPISHSGEIDLNADCTAVFTLDDVEIFRGDVNGLSEDGKINLADMPVDLGSYAPGESHRLNCTITWSGESADLVWNYGKRLVSRDGLFILEEADTAHYIEGEVIFRWIFCAAVDTDYEPPKTGISAAFNHIFLYLMAVCIFLILLLLLLLIRRQIKYKTRKCEQNDEKLC